MFLFFVTAFKAEAEPLIRHYDLQPDNSATLFPVFRNDNCALTISGPGKTASAAACAFLYRHINTQTTQLWCNIGIAGHQHQDIGTLMLADKIIDAASQQSWYPPQWLKHHIKTGTLTTVDQPELSYNSDTLYDMEASGFYQTASRCSNRELVQCFKVVSDNATNPANKSIFKKAGALIESATPEISEHITELLAHSKTGAPLIEQHYQTLLEHCHFTVSQQYLLRSHLQRLATLQGNSDISLDALLKQNRAALILQELQTQIQRAGEQVFCDD